MPTISGDHPDTYSINSTGKKYVFTNTFHGHDPDSNSIVALGGGNTIIMNGLVESVAGYYGISLGGANVTFRIGAEGVLRGAGPALLSGGADAHITNDGLIIGVAGYGAVFLNGDDTEFRNRGGIISSGNCVDVRGDGSVVTNERGGVIASTGSGGVPVVWMIGDPGESIKFINHGAVSGREGATPAVLGYDSDDKVRNTGTITGDIDLLKGDDLVDTRGGIIRGVIEGGVGNDTLVTDNANHKLVETSGQGEDQVKSTVSYTLSQYVENLVLIGKKNINGTGTTDGDRISGNSGDNTLKGLDGGDTLYGKGGNDGLIGGTGSDRFYFNKGYDRDTIRDFEQGADKVYIEDWNALSSLQEVKSHASNHGQDVWIKVGDDVLVFKGLHKADLTVDDFAFF